VPEIVEYYIANKKAVDFLVKNSKCPYCENEKLFGKLALVEHIEAKHTEKAPTREIRPKEPKKEKPAQLNKSDFLGNPRQRQAARKLHCAIIDENSIMVWGGREHHEVTLQDGSWICDCYHAVTAKTDCAHTTKIKFFLAEREIA